MSLSRQEEIISCLWILAAVLCFGFGFNGWGIAFSIKAVLDAVCSVVFAIKELKDES